MMKKLFTTIILAIVAVMGYAQTNPNRMLVTDKTGSTKGYLVERIDSVSFVSLEGRVAADVEYKGFYSGATGDTVALSVTRTPQCVGFKIACLSKVRADRLTTEEAIANYLDGSDSEILFQDFVDGRLHGFDFAFKPNAEYAIITVGYDQYQIPCGATRTNFTTPKKDLVGDCSINYTIDEVTTSDITVTFKPGSGVAGYAAILFPAGTAEENFEMMGPMFGFETLGDYVKGFGFNNTGEATNTWERNNPGTDYEVYVQAWDVNGTFADMVIIPVTTKKLGGEGLAQMEITVGNFGGDAQSGYYQVVTYTPNDQTSMHRDMLIEKDAYDKEWNEDMILEYLKADNPMDPYWNQFGVDEAYWTVDPNTSYIAFSIAQNINEEWGPLAKKEFTTPKAPASQKKQSAPVMKRKMVKNVISGSNSVPMMKLTKAMKASKGKMTMTGK